MRFFNFFILATLAACAAQPNFDDRIDAAGRNADYPTLQPLAPLIARAAALNTAGKITPASVASFDSRIGDLRNKAQRLRGPIIDSGTRARMRRGVAVPVAIR